MSLPSHGLATEHTAEILRWRFLIVSGAISLALAIGTIGFSVIEGWPPFDAFYMTLMTLTTVGYGEVHPLSQSGRVFAAFVMLVGVATVFLSIAVVGDALLRLELVDYFGGRRRNRMLQQMAGHYIVCGAGRVGRSVVLELLRSGAKVVLIDNDPDRLKWGDAHGVLTMMADASNDETLRRARIDTAAGLVSAIASDAENVYVTLSAKVLNPTLQIAVRASDEQAEEKLRRAGATTVLTPYTYIGHRLAQSMMRPHVVNFLDVASAFGRTDLELEIEQMPVAPGSALASKTLAEAHLGRTFGAIVLAVRRESGAMQFNPQADVRLESGDVIIAMGERQKLRELAKALKSPVAVVVMLLMIATAHLAAQTPATWLERALTRWNEAGANVPSRPSGGETHDALSRRCKSSAVGASAAGDGINKAGWVPFLHLDREIARDDVEVIGGMNAAGPGCEPSAFNLFVFVGRTFAGTISPNVMTAGRDGAVGAVRITGADALTAEFARFTPSDPECCPSARVRVTYRIDRASGRPVLVATEARQIR